MDTDTNVETTDESTASSKLIRKATIFAGAAIGLIIAGAVSLPKIRVHVDVEHDDAEAAEVETPVVDITSLPTND